MMTTQHVKNSTQHLVGAVVRIHLQHCRIHHSPVRRQRPVSQHTAFTARRYASAVFAVVACPCLTHARRYCVKTAEHGIAQATPHESPGTLVFCCQRYPRNSTGVTPYGGAKRKWGGLKSATFDEQLAILENGTRQTHSFY